MLVYDGDCGFCTKCVRLVAKLPADIDVEAWQFADLPSLGLTEAAAGAALQWVELDGTIRAGHVAIAALLIRAGRGWAIIGRSLLLPGVSFLAAVTYRFIAANRGRLPGGTAACALPPEQRPGYVSRLR